MRLNIPSNIFFDFRQAKYILVIVKRKAKKINEALLSLPKIEIKTNPRKKRKYE